MKRRTILATLHPTREASITMNAKVPVIKMELDTLGAGSNLTKQLGTGVALLEKPAARFTPRTKMETTRSP